MKNATEKSASQTSPSSSSRSVFSETDIIQLTCKRVTKEMNNTMWPFVIPLYIDDNDFLTVAIPHVNHNVFRPKIVSKICNNICGNPLRVKNKHKNKGGNDMSCILMYYNKVCHSVSADFCLL